MKVKVVVRWVAIGDMRRDYQVRQGEIRNYKPSDVYANVILADLT